MHCVPEWSPLLDSPAIQSQTPGFGTCSLQHTCVCNNVPPQSCWTIEAGKNLKTEEMNVKQKEKCVTSIRTHGHSPVWSGWRRSNGCRSQRVPRSGSAQLISCHFPLSNIHSGGQWKCGATEVTKLQLFSFSSHSYSFIQNWKYPKVKGRILVHFENKESYFYIVYWRWFSINITKKIKLTPFFRGLYTRHPSRYWSVWHSPLWRWRWWHPKPLKIRNHSKKKEVVTEKKKSGFHLLCRK